MLPDGTLAHSDAMKASVGCRQRNGRQ
jgi:hypothetical protein